MSGQQTTRDPRFAQSCDRDDAALFELEVQLLQITDPLQEGSKPRILPALHRTLTGQVAELTGCLDFMRSSN